jgi:serine/threonine-protein kinase HipA
MEHFDFKQAGAYSYEQVLRTIRKLGMPMETTEEQYRRMAFNIIGRNQDDHVKNIAFLMDKSGAWSLSPAFDMTYSYNPQGDWTSTHQMSLDGKRDDFSLENFKACAKNASMKRGRAEAIVDQVQSAVLHWKHFAKMAGVPDDVAARIATAQRTDILK